MPGPRVQSGMLNAFSICARVLEGGKIPYVQAIRGGMPG